MGRFVLGCTLTVAAIAGLHICAQPQTPSAAALDASVRVLRRGTTVQRANLHNELLRSLRAMRDPSLAPFFRRITEQPDMVVRINGILGLAEVSDDKQIDPFLLQQLSSELERLQTIDQAILFGLLDPPTIRKILAWDDLEETPQLTLLGELIKSGEPLSDDERDALTQLAQSEKETVQGLARLLLSQELDDPELFESYRTGLSSLGDRARLQARTWLLIDVGRFRLHRLLWWVEDILAEPGIDDRLVLGALAAAIHADSEKGVALWIAHAQDHREHVHLVRMGLLLLAMVADHDIAAEAFELLRDGEPLTEALANVGVALASGDRTVERFNDVFDIDHWQSSNQLIFASKKLTDHQRSRALQHLIWRVERSEHRPDERIALAIAAMPSLLDVDPDAIGTMLTDQVEDDSRLQEALLAGLLASDNPQAGELARLVPRRGSGRADSFALLLIAKHAETLAPDEFRQLGVIASGGGRLSPSFVVQAAWLYIKHADRIDYAMNQLFNQ